jgi:branched-chain amino acid transport system substrate-binding protein
MMFAFLQYRALAALVLIVSSIASARAVTAEDPYRIPVILPLTGSNAYFGKEAHDALGVMESVVNASGGIRGRSVQFEVVDSQSNPQVAVQLTNDLLSKKVPLFIGDASVATCAAMRPVVAVAGPVALCLSPGFTPSGYSFAIGAAGGKQIIYDIRWFRKHGITKLGLLLATDATGVSAGADFHTAVALPENAGVSIVADERFNPTDLSVAAQLARIRASGAQLLLTFTSGSPFGTVLRSYRDADMTIPVFSSQGNMSFAAMSAFGDMVPPGGLYFGNGPVPAPGVPAPKGPLKKVQEAYLHAFAAAGIRPDEAMAIVWDTVTVAVAALRGVGLDAGPDRVRTYINAMHGVPVVQGMLDFRSGDQRGLNDLRIVHWDHGAAAWEVLPDPK